MGKKEYNLEWYVLNDFGHRMPCEDKFNQYPYSNGDIKPFNVFCNWIFKDKAIELAKEYKKGGFLEKVKKEAYQDDHTQLEISKLKTDFDAFKYELIHALQWQEWSRCEYEIFVCPMFVKDNKYEEKFQKIDTYEQVLPNADIFAKYVLMTVNGTLDAKENK